MPPEEKRPVTRCKRWLPVLKVVDLQAAIDFYTGILGCTLHGRSADDRGGENCMLGLGEANLMLSTGAHLGGSPQFTGTLCIDMEGVEEFYERVKDRVELVWQVEVMDYGAREFGV